MDRSPHAELSVPHPGRLDSLGERANPQVSVVVPMFNEEANVRAVLARFVESLSRQRRSFELIAVNDGSRDRTGALLDELAAAEPRWLQSTSPATTGRRPRWPASGPPARPVIVPLDGDGQNEPDEVQRLVDKLEEGYDVVSGWRRDRKDSWLRTRVSRVANWIIGFITDAAPRLRLRAESLPGAHGPRRATCSARDAPLHPDLHQPARGALTEVVGKHHPRTAGTSKYGYGRIVKVALDIALVRCCRNAAQARCISLEDYAVRLAGYARVPALRSGHGGLAARGRPPQTRRGGAFWGKARWWARVLRAGLDRDHGRPGGGAGDAAQGLSLTKGATGKRRAA